MSMKFFEEVKWWMVKASILHLWENVLSGLQPVLSQNMTWDYPKHEAILCCLLLYKKGPNHVCELKCDSSLFFSLLIKEFKLAWMELAVVVDTFDKKKCVLSVSSRNAWYIDKGHSILIETRIDYDVFPIKENGER